VKLFQEAISKLTDSLRQEESSRAKYYLNQARKALWETSRMDRIPPVVRVKEPIYTNQWTVRLGVTVTDLQSGVAEIRVSAAYGGVKIARPKVLVERAQEEITEMVDLDIDSREKMAVIEIKALDLVGNESRPSKVRIVVDTRAPTAAVAITGRVRPQGPLAVFVRAVDDVGLREIQVGEDPNERFSCYGHRQYSGTVFGPSINGELVIRVVDIAGNAAVARIPVGEDSSPARLSRTAWLQTPWVAPLTASVAMYDWSQSFPPAQQPELGLYVPRTLGAIYWDGHVQPASLVSFRVWAAGETTGRKQPQFYFQPHVQPPDGKAKETSQDYFVVEGTLRNAEGVTQIKVNGDDIDPNMLQKILVQSGDDLLFSHIVDLANARVDVPTYVKVEAYQEGRLCDERTLTVIRRKNCIRERDAVYQVVLLLRTGSTPFAQSVWDDAIPEQVYQVVFDSLKNLRAREPHPLDREFAQRFSMYDVSLVLGEKYPVARTRSLDDVAERLRSRSRNDTPNYDLIIHGDITEWGGGGQKGLQITLRAMDTSTKADLQFPSTGRENTIVLAETYVPDAAGDQRLDIKNWRDHMGDLAANVGERLPRLRADVLDFAGTAGSTVSINRGRDDRLVPGMRLCFYTYTHGDDARVGNVYLKKIGHGWIDTLDRQSSRVHPRPDRRLIEGGLLAITK